MSTNQKSRGKSGRHNNKSNNRGRNQGGRGRKGGKKQQQQPLTATKQIDSNGPAGKIRGNVKQLYDKYKQLAHECRTKDRTLSEDYGQHAHHYYILYSEFAAAEAAAEVEREKERERQREAAAESQSNIVEIPDAETQEETSSEEEPVDAIAASEAIPEPLELPLDEPEKKEKPARKRAVRKPRKPKEEKATEIKEEVAE